MENYEELKMEVIRFEAEDIVTASLNEAEPVLLLK